MNRPPSVVAKRTATSALGYRSWLLLPIPLGRMIKRLLSGTAARFGAEGPGNVPVPPVGKVNFGDLRRTTPFCANYGFSRGDPVDRYYIEGFLALHAADIKGSVLEIGDSTYTKKFGGSRVTDSAVLHVAPVHGGVTIVGNLETGENIPAEAFGCF